MKLVIWREGFLFQIQFVKQERYTQFTHSRYFDLYQRSCSLIVAVTSDQQAMSDRNISSEYISLVLQIGSEIENLLFKLWSTILMNQSMFWFVVIYFFLSEMSSDGGKSYTYELVLIYIQLFTWCCWTNSVQLSSERRDTQKWCAQTSLQNVWPSGTWARALDFRYFNIYWWFQRGWKKFVFKIVRTQLITGLNCLHQL